MVKIQIGVLDYGLGNIGSVIRMIEKAGGTASAVIRPEELRRVDKLVIPGVGKFDHGISQIKNRNFLAPLTEYIQVQGSPVLGICLGMQILCNRSEEGSLNGLGFVDAEVKKFNFTGSQGLKVPHMGWSKVLVNRINPLIDNSDVPRYYFVHSYRVVPTSEEIVIAKANYGIDFCAAFQFGNIFGVQFHPEKSHRFGKELIRRFVEMP